MQGKQRLKWQAWACMGLHQVLCINVMAIGWCFLWDSCSWNSFPPITLPCSALIGGLLLYRFVSCFALFDHHLLETCSLLKKKWTGSGSRREGRWARTVFLRRADMDSTILFIRNNDQPWLNLEKPQMLGTSEACAEIWCSTKDKSSKDHMTETSFLQPYFLCNSSNGGKNTKSTPEWPAQGRNAWFPRASGSLQYGE